MKRRIAQQQCKGQLSFNFLQLVLFALSILSRDELCFALSPSVSSKSTTRRNQILSNTRGGISASVVASSPLFASTTRRMQLQRSQSRRRDAGSSSTALHMVLTIPESVIEQASTVNLLDDLIDESVRTSARRPIMMQFDPSSGWVSLILDINYAFRGNED
jgi:hypothetical protein